MNILKLLNENLNMYLSNLFLIPSSNSFSFCLAVDTFTSLTPWNLIYLFLDKM